MNSWFGLIKVLARPEVEVDLEPEDLDMFMGDDGGAVSYTHLTLPTNREV